MGEYRRGALRCPGCDELLDEELHGRAHLDVCPACQGIWIDWLDGDIATVTAAVGERNGPRAQAQGSGRCPLCRAALDRATLENDEAVIWRCGSCAGAFVPRPSVRAVVATLRQDDEPNGQDPPLTRLLDAVSRLLFGG